MQALIGSNTLFSSGPIGALLLQGDSGFLLMRSGNVVFRSPALQHFFDCPLQFAAFPDYTNATDTSDDAGLYELPLQVGDILVAGTDGLWDNMQQEEIVASVPSSTEERSQVPSRRPSSAENFQAADSAAASRLHV